MSALRVERQADSLSAGELRPRLVRLLKAWQGNPHAFTPPPASQWYAPVVIIDGHSGSGKSTLLADIACDLRIAGVRQVNYLSPDAYFPGWYGLHSGSQTTVRLLTGSPVLRGCRPACVHEPRMRGVRLWDWQRGTWGGYSLLNPNWPLVIEGSGSLTPMAAAAASLRVWVEVPDGEGDRRVRAIARDGDLYAPWWDVWAQQEAQHLSAHDPRSLADVIVVNPFWQMSGAGA